MTSERTRWLAVVIAAALAGPSPNVYAATESNRIGGAFGAYLAGRSAAQSHDLAFAADQLERATVDDPGNPELNSQAFLAALLSGQPQMTRLAAALPDNPLAQIVIADRDAKAGKWDVAASEFAALPQQQVLTQVLRPLVIAWAQQGAGHTDDALATLAPLIDGPRFRGVYALHAALIADLAGRPDVAGPFYSRAAADYGPANLRLATILASWQARSGQLDAAQKTIDGMAGAEGDLAMARQALEANVATRAVTSAADGIAEAYLAFAATLREENAELGQAMVRLALDMRPDLMPARLLLSDIQSADKRPQEALATLKMVPSSDPLAPLITLRRATLLDETDQTDQAEALLQKLAQDYPDRSEALAQQGDILRRKKRFSEAAAAYTAAIGRLGTPHRADWPMFYARGISLERSGSWPVAEQDLQYALQLAPEQPSILNYLAYSWAERGEHLAEARKMLETAIGSKPNDGAIIDSLGWVMLRQGETAGALLQLQHAAELEPEDPVINGHLGDALAAAGRMREAEFQWRRALILKPDDADAKKLNEKLAALPAPAQPQ